MPCNNEKMINFDEMTNENNKKHNPNCRKCLVHALTSLLIGVSRLGKTHALLNIFNHQPDIGNIFYLQKTYIN